MVSSREAWWLNAAIFASVVRVRHRSRERGERGYLQVRGALPGSAILQPNFIRA